MEGSRVVAGCFISGLHSDNFTIASHLKNLIYTVEIACANKKNERAIRVSVFDQATEMTLLSVVFIDNSLFDKPRDLLLREDIKFAVKSGFTDSLAIL